MNLDNTFTLNSETPRIGRTCDLCYHSFLHNDEYCMVLLYYSYNMTHGGVVLSHTQHDWS